jgi:hypothetical protein
MFILFLADRPLRQQFLGAMVFPFEPPQVRFHLLEVPLGPLELGLERSRIDLEQDLFFVGERTIREVDLGHVPRHPRTHLHSDAGVGLARELRIIRDLSQDGHVILDIRKRRPERGRARPLASPHRSQQEKK